MLASFKGSFKKFNTKSRVGLCALSAGWTGSCQSDEKKVLAVHRPHPAAIREITTAILPWLSVRGSAVKIWKQQPGSERLSPIVVEWVLQRR